MALLAYNKSGAPLALAHGGVTLPAAGGAVDVTVALSALTALQYADLEAQRVGPPQTVRYKWTGDAAPGWPGEGILHVEEPHQEFEVADLTALATLDDADIPDAAEVLVLSLGQYFRLDKTSALAVDGITVVTASVGRWLRMIAAVPKWTNQQAWYVNPAALNDEGDGSLGSPLQTVAEFCRRVVDFKVDAAAPYYTLNLLADIPATDVFRPTGTVDAKGVSSGNVQIIRVKGTMTTVAGPDVTGAGSSITNPAANAQALFDGGPLFDPDAHLGKMVTITSAGPSLNVTAWITGKAGANVAYVTNWTLLNNAALTPLSLLKNAPGAGLAYTLSTPSKFDCKIDTLGSPIMRYRFEDLWFSAAAGDTFTLKSVSATFATCRIEKQLGNPNSLLTYVYCYIGNTDPVLGGGLFQFGSIDGGTHEIVGSGLRNVILIATSGSEVIVNNTHSIGGYLRSGSTANLPAFGSLFSAGAQRGGVFSIRGYANGDIGAALGFGLFEPPTAKAGFALQRSAHLNVVAPFYGTGAVGGSLQAMTVKEGATMEILSTVTPTVTNTGGEVQLDGSATAFQSLEIFAGGVLPPPVPLGTWAQWNAAVVNGVSGFNRNVLSLKSGAKIISFVAPV